MSEINLDKQFVDYAMNEVELVEAEKRTYNLRRLSDDLKSEIATLDTEGCYALEFSAHAFRNIAERIEALAMENSTIFMRVFRADSPADSIITPSNLRSYILALLAKAKKDGHVSMFPSKNNPNSKEYHYVIEIDEWSSDDHKLVFTGIVEKNVLKTGYFNWN